MILQNQSLPNITGKFTATSPRYGSTAEGAFEIDSQPAASVTGVGVQWYEPRFNFDASRISRIYGRSSNVQTVNTTVRLWKRIS